MSLNHLWDSILQLLEFGDEELLFEKIVDELNSKVTLLRGRHSFSPQNFNLRACFTSLAEAGRGMCSTC